jgi:SAM-dependent MidA family methyltransferase
MRLPSAVDQEIRELIQKHGRITFAQFMQTCLYSPRGGFYSSRANDISTHFRTSPTSHPVFGALIARQLEEMWRLLGDPSPFHVIEVGSGDGALARSIFEASRRMAPGLAEALCYVAADYEPWWPPPPTHPTGSDDGTEGRARPIGQDKGWAIQRVKAEGLRPFRNVVGCILSNELLDNFPVHRFVIQAGRVKEVFVTLAGDSFTEVLDDPSTPRIGERLTSLGLSLPEGSRGEVNLAMEDWTAQLAETLERGFILTIDYGQLAQDLYSPQYAQGTLVCFHQHAQSTDPYQHIGQQDITTLVDFMSLMRLGERRGLATLGFTPQRHFLENLGFSSFLDALETQGLSYARKELARMAMMSLVDPEEHGDFKVLAQAKGIGPGMDLLGFKGQGP